MTNVYKKRVIIIGAGPAGLMAGIRLQKEGVETLILEKRKIPGGISRTENFDGYRIDIGGHRFFTKNLVIRNLWDEMIKEGFMKRGRLSRILYKDNYYNYPLSLSLDTLWKLGFFKTVRIVSSYSKATLLKKEEKTLEDFLINHFGFELYDTFFREYTAKVWGKECHEISAEWGKQRIKGVSLSEAVKNAFLKLLHIKEKKQQTSLIDAFFYPKHGPGELWEDVASYYISLGGEIKYDEYVEKIALPQENRVEIWSQHNNYKGTDVLSTLPIKDLFIALKEGDVPIENAVYKVATHLEYRDFAVAGVLLDQIVELKDNWIYIQEPGFKAGRLQIFNNWSPYMIKDENKTWVGLEYFYTEGIDDAFLSDLEGLAKKEIKELGFLGEIEKVVVIKEPKAYPAYFGSYNRFNEVKEVINQIKNLHVAGRNGTHRYNNMDHSSLSGIVAADIVLGKEKTEAIWRVNAEKEYHES